MNKTVEEAVSSIKELKKLLNNEKIVEVAVCPPFTALEAVSKLLKSANIKLGAQNMHFADSGAFTGEISGNMLKNLDCEYVILGHSERREFFHEDNSLINKKVASALKHDLKPILCVGEDLEQRRNELTSEAIEKQLRKSLENIKKQQMTNLVIAYEPVWAISRGDPNTKAATPKDAVDAHKFIRDILVDIFDQDIALETRIIYGGSMKPDNANDLLSKPGIDGGLVGNASLNPKSFFEIINAAR